MKFIVCLILAGHSLVALASPCQVRLATGISRRSLLAGVATFPFFARRGLASTLGLELPSLRSEGAVFINHSNPQEFVVLEDQWITRLDGIHQTRSPLGVVDPRCAVEALKGSIFAADYFLGMDLVCRLNGNRLEFVAGLPVPRYAFSSAYMGEDDRFIYTLVNSGSFPAPGEGHLHLRGLDRQTQQTREIVVAEHVPDFSGGLWAEGPNVYVTVATASSEGQPTNAIFALDATELRATFRSGKAENFLEIARKVGGPFRGLSLSLINGPAGFLFDNNYFGRYVISRDYGQKRDSGLPADCEIVGPWRNQWLTRCGTTLRVF